MSLCMLTFSWTLHPGPQLKTEGSEDANGVSERSIGILDIFGFECFKENSFEQLCINFCNEKLQGHFTEHMVKLELEQYAAEGVDAANIEYQDNQACLDLLEAKGTGIFAVIHDEMNSPGAADKRLIEKMVSGHGPAPGRKQHPNFTKSPRDMDKFTIHHYAGEVKYTVNGFLEKNRDEAPEVSGCVAKESFVSTLDSLLTEQAKQEAKAKAESQGGAPALRRARSGKQVKQALGIKFQGEVATLVAKIKAADAHFVRCIKPNLQSLPDNFQDDAVLSQLAACGLLAVVKVRQSGYAENVLHADFVARFRPCLQGCGDWWTVTDCADLVARLSSAAPNESSSALLNPDQCAQGTSKLFMKSDAVAALETRRGVVRGCAALRLQRYSRGMAQRKYYVRCKAALAQLLEATAQRSKAGIVAQLEATCEVLPFGGVRAKQVLEARAVVKQIELEEAALERLEEVMPTRTPGTLHAASFTLGTLTKALAEVTKLGVSSPLVRHLSPAPVLLQRRVWMGF
ncbi:hypothetical protein CYMTET_20200 [Cymbomonas tetramitiformis]|uniref:Myosin motor domain-containing protein n=1 Tax=Cymbomonas tetramitiformis TaxID=36881 RepID=A0AAE0G4K5_9CHLO|nr:hypothetical protein CYMTET_20200 [Cymbomonas tetramitiformis]